MIEAAQRSGTLITAREAGERGGDVMAVPGSPLDGRTEGFNHLIREGATLVRDINDILECLANPPVASLPTAKEWRDARLSPGTEKELRQVVPRSLRPLGAEATGIDEIIRWCEEPVSTVLVAISELELADSHQPPSWHPYLPHRGSWHFRLNFSPRL